MALLNWTTFPLPEARIMEPLDGRGIHQLGWNVAPEDLIHIPEHWLKYPEPEYSLHLLLGLVYIFFFFASMIGNGLVLWIFSAYIVFDLVLASTINSCFNVYHATYCGMMFAQQIGDTTLTISLNMSITIIHIEDVIISGLFLMEKCNF